MTNDLNYVALIGRLTRDAELRYTRSGTAVCTFSLAVNKRRKSGSEWTEDVSFFDITLWGKSGEAINRYLEKGKQIAVSGELRQSRWESDGQTRSKVGVVASMIQLLGGGAANNQTQQQKQGQSQFYGPTDFDDDIPF